MFVWCHLCVGWQGHVLLQIRPPFLPNKNCFPCRWLCFPTQFRERSHFRNTAQVRLGYFFIFLFLWVFCSESSHWDWMLFNMLSLKIAGLWIVIHLPQNIFFGLRAKAQCECLINAAWAALGCRSWCQGTVQKDDGLLWFLLHLPNCHGFCHYLYGISSDIRVPGVRQLKWNQSF